MAGEETELEVPLDLGDALRLLEPSLERLGAGDPLRRRIPGGGRVEIERPVPFVLAYRYPEGDEDLGTASLVTSEAAWMCVPGEAEHHPAVSRFCRAVEEALLGHEGACATLEIWAAPTPPETPEREEPEALAPLPATPAFTVYHQGAPPELLDPLVGELEEIEIAFERAEVRVDGNGAVAPPGMEPLFGEPQGPTQARLGIEVKPIYRGYTDEGEEVTYPIYLSALRRQLSTALRRALHVFARRHLESPPHHYASLGPRGRSDILQEVESGLCDLSDSFDLLLLVTPFNAAQAREDFRESGYEEEPALHYRPLPFRPGALKRRLYSLPVESVQDPTLSLLLEEKRRELDLQISALEAIGTPDFLLICRQIYGDVNRVELECARELLSLSGRARTDGSEPSDPILSLDTVRQRVCDEIDRYARRDETFKPPVQVRDDIAAGMMASDGRLFIARNLKVSSRRIEALLHHEIGTHIVAHHNGRAQPLRLLGGGLAGYEELQEGLAVLGEIVSGGMTRHRWRTLAARIVASHALIGGADFVECFRLLADEHGMSKKAAFGITLRVYRGGGFPKDAIYLRGLLRILTAIDQEIDLESLYVGRLGLHHAALVEELRHRGHVRPPRLTPRYLREEDCLDRLEAIRHQPITKIAEEAFR